jgi:AraC-like DNA-binding protein
MGSIDSIPFIYASVIAPVPDLIAEFGGRVDRPFREADVPVELASEPERILPMRSYLALLEAAARETGDEHFGLSMAEGFKIDDLGPFGRLITGAPTLRRAIGVADALVQYFSPASRCWLCIEGETARWHYQVTGIRDRREGRRLDCEKTMLLFRTVIRLATSPGWQPDEILLEQATPHQLRAFQSRFGAPARCAGNSYALVFPTALLDLPMTFARTLGQMERRGLLQRLITSKPSDSLVGLLRAIIRGQLSGGYPKISRLSQMSGLSVRTLQRRLAQEGKAFSHLVSEVRGELAQEFLADPSRNQLEISLSLGYSEAASFTRAFKQWTGTTPSEFRRSPGRMPTVA